MIKKADPSDIQTIFNIFKQAHCVSCYSFIPYDEALVKKQIGHYILQGFAYLDEEGKGALVARVENFWFNREKTVAKDLVFYVDDGNNKLAVQLMKKYIEWAEDNADYCCLGVSIGGERMNKVENFYTRFGFSRIGGDFIRGF